MDIRKIIESTGNLVFGVTFTKADGSTRNMQARLHVAKPKHVTAPTGAVDRKQNDIDTDTMTVFDMNKVVNGKRGAYRRFKLGAVRELRIKGKIYPV
jgi:hypothetical protein